MSDDEDWPDEVFTMLDAIERQAAKVPTVSQGGAAVFGAGQPPAASNQAALTQAHAAPWRPAPVQHAPAAPPARPLSLAQQLLGSGALPRPPAIGGFAAPLGGQHHQHAPWQQQQQQPRVPAPVPSAAPQQHHQHHQHHQQQQQPQAWGPARQAWSATQQAAPAPGGEPAPGCAGGAAAAPHQHQQQHQPAAALAPQQLQAQLERLQLELRSQAGVAAQLRSKLEAAERDKAQLSARLQANPLANNAAQQRAKELEKQVEILRNRLLFAEQEAQEASNKANDKDSRAAQAQDGLRAAEADLARKQEQLLQLQLELEQERKRSERLAEGSSGGGGARAGGSGVGAGQPSPSAAHSTPGGALGGRKRRASDASGAAGGVGGPAGSQAQLTPQQQARQAQMQQLLEGRPSAGKAPLQLQRLGGAPGRDSASAAPPAHEAMEVEPPADDDVLQPQRQQHDQGPGGAAAAREADSEPPAQQQQQQQQQQRNSFAGRLIPGLPPLQVVQPPLAQLLWGRCEGSMQQLLLPLAAQLSGLPAGLGGGAPGAFVNSGRLAAALAGVQRQLQLLSAGAASSGAPLLLGLLQLGVAALPPSAAPLPPGGDGSAPPESCWALVPPPGGHADSPRAAQQQEQECLVFQAAADASALHALPLPLARAALQLLQALLALDDGSIGLAAAALGAAQLPDSYRLLSMQRCGAAGGGPGGGQRPASRALDGRGSSAASLLGSSWALDGGSGAPGAGAGAPQGGSGLSWSAQSAGSGGGAPSAAAEAAWGPAEAAVQAALAAGGGVPAPAAASSAGGSETAARPHSLSSAGGGSQGCREQRGLLGLLADAASCHASLALAVGELLAALAGRLPAPLRSLLLPAVADVRLLLALLAAADHRQRAQAAALLQELLACRAVAAAFDAAAQAAGGGDAGAAGGADGAADGARPLQPCNRAPGAAPGGRGASKPPPDKAAAVAAARGDAPHAGGALPGPVVRDALLGLLDCIASGLDDARCRPDGGGGGWGAFELQRRSCAAAAQLLHARQELLLQLLLDPVFTSGYGLAQRLLVLTDAACSAPGGDPFCIAAARAPAAAGGADGSDEDSGGGGGGGGANICGARCAWDECLQRVRLAQEGLLLLRALVASPGPIGAAAMADLSSSTNSLRLIMTTRAKLSEWSEALTAPTACAPGGAGRRAALAPPPGSGEAAPGAAAGLPLAPWAWPLSAGCGCRAGKGGGGGSAALLRGAAPPLAACLGEAAAGAASVHRRVMLWIRSQEGE
ncbi:hypothetical protein HT031_004134 [Scenedesmus sp. PABB004]|nr:hypothetical protein HT031_004134 [Scenedesmus sp. PABB004]